MNSTERNQAVLLAVAYGSERWTDCSLTDVIGQLTCPRLQSGAGILPVDLSGSQVERALTTLRQEGLIDSVPAIGRSGRRWVTTQEGRTQVQQLVMEFEQLQLA